MIPGSRENMVKLGTSFIGGGIYCKICSLHLPMEVLCNHTSGGSLGFACLLTLALKLSHSFCHRFLSVAQTGIFFRESLFCNLALPLKILLTSIEQDLFLCCNHNTSLTPTF